MTGRIGVAQIVHSLDVGGVEKVVLSLLDGLDTRRFDPHLICLSGSGRLQGEVNLPAEATLLLSKQPRRPFLGLFPLAVDLRALLAIRRFVRERHLQVLHAHNAGPLVYGGLAARLTWPARPTVLYSEHNQIYSATPAALRRFRLYLRLAHHVVAVSQDLKRTLESGFAAPGSVVVIENGIDGRQFSFRQDSPIRRELGIGTSEFLVGTAVVLSRQKGIEYLLRAAPAVLKESPRTRFLIAGEGPERPALEALAKELGVGDRVLFLGYRRDVADLISALDLYVLPSLWEGLPLALIEALAIGKPILCTNVGGSTDIVEDGVNGFVVPAGDASALANGILAAGQHREFSTHVRERNRRKFQERFSVEAMVERHATLYQSAVASWS